MSREQPGFESPALQREIKKLRHITLAAVTIYRPPERAVFRSPLRSVYSTRFASVLRLGYYTLLLAILSHLRGATGGVSTLYVVTLWLVPLGSSFMFFMFLRDVCSIPSLMPGA